MPLSFILSLVCAWWLHIFLLYIQAVLWLLPRSAICQIFYTSTISNISKFKIWNSLVWHSLAPDHVNYVPFIVMVLKSINLLGGSLPHFYVLFYTFATGSALSMGKIVIPRSANLLWFFLKNNNASTPTRHATSQEEELTDLDDLILADGDRIGQADTEGADYTDWSRWLLGMKRW